MKKFFYILLIIIFLSLTVSCQRRQDRSISPSPSTSSTPSSGLPPLSRLQTAPEVPLEIRPNLLKRKLTLEEYPGWLREYLQSRVWRKIDFKPQLSRSLLEESLNLGTQYLVRNQKPEGNFRYEYHFISNKLNDEENQVRQAGVVWGLALIQYHSPSPEVRIALQRALEFFFKHTLPLPEAESAYGIAYPGESLCMTGTVALVGLGIIEYLRTAQEGKIDLLEVERNTLKRHLDGYLKYLLVMRLESKHFSHFYRMADRKRALTSSPYFDGESLLCLIRAAKYLGYTTLIPVIEESALVMAKAYTIDEWIKNVDSDETKGFFQWSCMAFWEYSTTDWSQAETFGDYVLALSWWMIYTHKILNRTRNTAYAYEGLIYAYQVAEKRQQAQALAELAYTIDQGLFKLTTWQVGSPVQNEFIRNFPPKNDLARGGILNHAQEEGLRIDVVQHQMHSVLLALRYLSLK